MLSSIRFPALPAAAVLAASLALPGLAQAFTLTTARGPMEINKTPERVVVFDMAALDTIEALGVEPVGVTDNTYVTYIKRGDAETVGTLFEPNMEAVAALQPDLIIIGGRSAKQFDALSRIAPVADMTMPTDVAAGAEERLKEYGALFGKEDKAAELAQAYEAKLKEVEAAAEGKGKALIVMANGPKLSAYGRGSRFGWLHDTIGLEEAHPGLEVAGHGDAISMEFIAETDPDWLIVVDRAVAIGREAEDGTAQATLDNPLVAGTKAAKAGQVVYLSPAPLYIAGGGYQQMMGTMDEILAAFRKGS
ncbi:siderophore ABC transporter substrate-binding protein [Frigidibacter sp. MR17.14]|uniref:siderophore ABC transporter substrate-binding protein n=1 Tax=Frigidibacter sp. MR17.14 TaxID=3126509 RepID=UPI003012BD20